MGYKFGVLYQKKNQTTENEFLANETDPVFQEFLQFLDHVMCLGDTTGKHTVFTKISGFSVIFHVCTMLPTTKGDIQQVEKKRHIGNDIIVIVFKEDESVPFDPCCILSEFNRKKF